MTVALRPDQLAIVDGVREHLRAGLRSVLVVAPTGAGKGEIISHFLRAAHGAGARALFAVHLSEIALDVRARIVAAGLPPERVRVLMGSHSQGAEDAPITIASWQTLAARGSALDVSLVLADEAHRTKARTVLEVLDRHRGARILGFTATGQRGDGSGLGEVGFQRIVAGPQIAALVAQGHLCPVRVLAPDAFVPELADEPADAYVREARERPGIVFASSISHSQAIAEGLRARGLRAMHVDSDTPADERAEAVAALDAGRLDVLTNFRLFVEGINVRRVSCVALATSFSHDGPYLQAIGRGRRAVGGKSDCLVLDLRGNIHRRGHPDEARVYSLDGKGCALAAPLTPAVCCAACLGWFAPSRVCPGCGATLPPPKPPKVTKRELREQRLARIVKAGPDWEAWVEIVQEARVRGYSNRAPAMRWHRERGYWPRFTVGMVAS